MPAPTPRKRGRAGCKDRGRRRRLHPLCALCLDKGRVTATEHIDHIVPLSKGGADTDENTRGLCLDHHKRVSAEQRHSNVPTHRRRMERADGW